MLTTVEVAVAAPPRGGAAAVVVATVIGQLQSLAGDGVPDGEAGAQGSQSAIAAGGRGVAVEEDAAVPQVAGGDRCGGGGAVGGGGDEVEPARF